MLRWPNELRSNKSESASFSLLDSADPPSAGALLGLHRKRRGRKRQKPVSASLGLRKSRSNPDKRSVTKRQQTRKKPSSQLPLPPRTSDGVQALISEAGDREEKADGNRRVSKRLVYGTNNEWETQSDHLILFSLPKGAMKVVSLKMLQRKSPYG